MLSIFITTEGQGVLHASSEKVFKLRENVFNVVPFIESNDVCVCISLCGIIKEWGASNLQSENYYKRAT